MRGVTHALTTLFKCSRLSPHGKVLFRNPTVISTSAIHIRDCEHPRKERPAVPVSHLETRSGAKKAQKVNHPIAQTLSPTHTLSAIRTSHATAREMYSRCGIASLTNLPQCLGPGIVARYRRECPSRRGVLYGHRVWPKRK